METTVRRYRVLMETTPGMYMQHKTAIIVNAFDPNDAAEAAQEKIRRGAYSSYSPDMWRITKITRILS